MNNYVTWKQALAMVEEIEDSRRALSRWERGVINKAYVFGLSKQDLPETLSEMLENVYFNRYRKLQLSREASR